MIVLLISSIFCLQPRHKTIYYGNKVLCLATLHIPAQIYFNKCTQKRKDSNCEKAYEIIENLKNSIFCKEFEDISTLSNELKNVESATIIITQDNYKLDLSFISCPMLAIATTENVKKLYVKGGDVSKKIPVIGFEAHVIFDGDFKADTIIIKSFESGNVIANRAIVYPGYEKKIQAVKKQINFHLVQEIKIDEEHFEVDSYSIKYKDNIGIIINPYFSHNSPQLTLVNNCKEESSIEMHFDDPMTSISSNYLNPDDFVLYLHLEDYLDSLALPLSFIQFSPNSWSDSKLKLNITTSPKSKNLFDFNNIPYILRGKQMEDKTFVLEETKKTNNFVIIIVCVVILVIILLIAGFIIYKKRCVNHTNLSNA